MRGDTIIVEEHHRKAAAEIAPVILLKIETALGKYTISVAGESGSGKSETATAIACALAEKGVKSIIFQQDDYFVYPPKSNDRTRREDISWVGPQEVRLNLLDEHLQDFVDGVGKIEKPLVLYEDDCIVSDALDPDGARVAIAEGSYTTLLDKIDTRMFIDRDYEDTLAHRQKRNRDASELDAFTADVLKIEHDIISSHKSRADIIINQDYTVGLPD